MKIVIIVEGQTESAFKEKLREFLKNRLIGQMPDLAFRPEHGRIPKGDKLKRDVKNYLTGKDAADFVIALTDVYTGPYPYDFQSAQDAKDKMRQWVGKEERFYPHVALHDFEAWLIPYWDIIRKKAGHNAASPGSNPETINHDTPPAKHLQNIYSRGGRRYIKTSDSKAILRDVDLTIAINACPELKAFINTIITLSGGAPL